MGQAATVDGPVPCSTSAPFGPEGPAGHARPFSLDRVKSLSSNALVTAARYHNCAQGGRRLADDYVTTKQVIGSGACGQVMLALGRADQRRYALKTMRKGHLTDNRMQHLTSEVEIYLTLDHPNIAHLHDVFETEEATCLITHFCEGGELYARLQHLGYFPEAQAGEAVRQMLCAVGYLHSHHIVHRDIKLENFVYENWDSYANLKLIDFGMAILWDQSTPMQMQCGSLMYVSPDVLCGEGYTDKCDLWSLGVIAWMLLTGFPPFDGADEDLMDRIRAGSADWSRNNAWDGICLQARDFVRQLLETDPQYRPNAQKAMRHVWLEPSAAEMEAHLESFSADILRSLQQYAEGSPLRRALLQFLAHELAPQETRDLHRAFLFLDQTNKGTVCLSELQDAIRRAEARQRSPRKLSWLQSITQEAASPPAPERTGEACGDPYAGLFSKLDVNGDQQIYFLDFLAAAAGSLRSICKGSLLATFNRLDAEGSGAISTENLRKALGGTFEGSSIEELRASAKLCENAEISFNAFVQLLGLSNVATAVPPAQPKQSRLSSLVAKKDVRKGSGIWDARTGSSTKPDLPSGSAAPCGSTFVAELPKERKKVYMSECRVAPELFVEVIEWAITMFAPANGPGGLGTSAVALFGSPGAAAAAGDPGVLGASAVALFGSPGTDAGHKRPALPPSPTGSTGTCRVPALPAVSADEGLPSLSGQVYLGQSPQAEGAPWERGRLPRVRSQRSRTWQHS
uniref:Non-specific serine/threonine protein kinase n=1 Tax=Alexandrium catenella TaxID=2925 RepID=A0A7S1WKW6_ALECA|mmetsp:Transcript_69854/g.185677  ORF Transcript_69854/g.185677 Transcript_69854/m.185677 type:complete len:742 (+) Transcript_69854:68-2293(+)